MVPVAAWRQRTATQTVTALGAPARRSVTIAPWPASAHRPNPKTLGLPGRPRLLHHCVPHSRLAMLHRVQNGQKALADVRSQQGQPIQELTIGGSRADQHRRHWNRRSRTGISRPLGAGTGVVGLIEIP